MRAGLLLTLLLIGGCAGGNAARETGHCCENGEQQPRWAVRLAEPFAPLVGRTIGSIAWRRGYLADPTAHGPIMRRLAPLDIVAVSSQGRLSGATIPGLFQHVAVHLGDEAELRRLGIWHHPLVRPYHEAIGKGAVFVEADQNGVHLSTASTVFNTDSVVVARPRIGTAGWKRRAALTLFGNIGGRFDFHFDASSSEAVFCTELVCRAMPELRLPRDRIYGRTTIFPDRVARAAATGGGRLDLVGYLRGDRTGRDWLSRRALRLHLDEAWPRP